MKMLAAALILLTTLAYAEGETYRWVDERGVVHFSDRPHPGAELIQLRPAQGFAAPAAQTAAAASAGATEPLGYDVFEVSSPRNEETLWNIATEMSINLSIRPALRPGHRIDLRVDGQPVTEAPTRATQFQIGGVYRGAHSIQATVVDDAGNTVQAAAPVTFYVRQTSIQQPRPAPTRRPGGG